jgi:hypothetical protein
MSQFDGLADVAATADLPSRRAPRAAYRSGHRPQSGLPRALSRTGYCTTVTNRGYRAVGERVRAWDIRDTAVRLMRLASVLAAFVCLAAFFDKPPLLFETPNDL